MKKGLAHLPPDKQDQLELIKALILAKIPDVRMVVLFGSYARGGWVEDIHIEGHTTHEYKSDFDILVATKSKKTAEDADLHDRVEKAIEATAKVDTPYSIIYHTFDYVRQMVGEGHYFFTDIKKEGVHLYHTGKHSLGKARKLTAEERKRIAKEDFKQWFKSAKEFYGAYESELQKRHNKIGAFLLHQATERFYSAVTLVFINYRFRSHNIEMLGRKAVRYNVEFAKVFPCDTQQYQKAFTLLKKAYIDARYKKDYRITKKQLEYLAERVKLLERLTRTICKEKIGSSV